MLLSRSSLILASEHVNFVCHICNSFLHIPWNLLIRILTVSSKTLMPEDLGRLICWVVGLLLEKRGGAAHQLSIVPNSNSDNLQNGWKAHRFSAELHTDVRIIFIVKVWRNWRLRRSQRSRLSVRVLNDCDGAVNISNGEAVSKKERHTSVNTGPNTKG